MDNQDKPSRRRSPKGAAGTSGKKYASKGSGRKSTKGSGQKHSQPSGKRGSGSDRQQSGKDPDGKRRRDLKGAAADLPNWVIEALERVTPKERVPGALEALGEASAAMNDGRYHAAVKYARRAKELSSQDATVRETLGLASYRVGDWNTAVRELRAYRRMAGDPTHLPVEIDALRAQGRVRDVETAWETLKRMDTGPVVQREGRVVYASHLLDQGDVEAAWALTAPKKVRDGADESEYRVWYVAARAAARLGDVRTARQIADVIVRNDPGFPGLDALEREIAAAR